MAVAEKYLKQNFPFFPSIIEHIYKNVSEDIVWKLYQSCKFFFIKFRPTFANELRSVDDANKHHFWINQNISITDLDGNIWTLEEFNNVNKNFILIKRLYLLSASIVPDNILPCFTECDISHLPNLPFDGFKKIVKYAEVLHLSNTKIYFSDDTIAHFEDILSCIPQTYYLYVTHSCCFSSKTENLLPLIERKQKFSNLMLLSIEGNIDTAKLYEFIVKNVQPQATVEVSFIKNQ